MTCDRYCDHDRDHIFAPYLQVEMIKIEMNGEEEFMSMTIEIDLLVHIAELIFWV